MNTKNATKLIKMHMLSTYICKWMANSSTTYIFWENKMLHIPPKMPLKYLKSTCVPHILNEILSCWLWCTININS